MGRITERITVIGHLSNHNDEQDEIDEARWQELRTAIQALTAQPRYKDLSVEVD